MARCPFAIWKPLPANAKQARMIPRLVINHTAVDAPGETDLYGWFLSSGLESHFFLQNDGDLYQYMDTEVVAEANYKANQFAVSIETEDDGAPRTTPWNPKQVEMLVRLHDWLCTVHPTIPRRKADRWDGSGIGWHSMWGFNTTANRGVNPWTSAIGKDCPGAPRIAQMPDIISRVANGKIESRGFLMALSDNEQRTMYNRVMGFLRQRWFLTFPDGSIRECPEGTPNARPAAALDTLDGNYLVSQIVNLETRLRVIEAKIDSLSTGG